MNQDILEIPLDLLTPTTLATMWLDYTNTIESHLDKGDLAATLSLLRQDADEIFAHLQYEHFCGDADAVRQFIEKLDHLPF
jgi:hypothetical protein